MTRRYYDDEYDDRFDEDPPEPDEPEREEFGADDMTQADKDAAADAQEPGQGEG